MTPLLHVRVGCLTRRDKCPHVRDGCQALRDPGLHVGDGCQQRVTRSLHGRDGCQQCVTRSLHVRYGCQTVSDRSPALAVRLAARAGSLASTSLHLVAGDLEPALARAGVELRGALRIDGDAGAVGVVIAEVVATLGLIGVARLPK